MISHVQRATRRVIGLGRSAARRAVRVSRGNPNKYLASCNGVVHVGANTGQEAKIYASLNLPVLWIEPIPDVFKVLLDNIKQYPNQSALNALITDRDDDIHTLHVASNHGESSSILDLHEHKDIRPDITYVKDISCSSLTLPSAIRDAETGSHGYDALVMDTQGSELLILKGARDILRTFKYIKTEAADFESYKDCATVASLGEYLSEFDITIVRKDKFARRDKGGSYFDILFKRAS